MIGLDASWPDPIGIDPLRETGELHRLRGLVEQNADWIWEVDAAGIYTYSSPRCLELLGREPREVVGRRRFDLMLPDEAARAALEFGAIVSEQRPFSGLITRNRHRDGRIVVLETSGVPIHDADGVFRGFRGIDRDVTARMAEMDELRRLAWTDDLTDLPNRRRAKVALEERLQSLSRRETGCLAVVFFDLDALKETNDTFGHEAGDQRLVTVANCLRAHRRADDDMVGRWGGDEFVLLAWVDNAEDGLAYARELADCGHHDGYSMSGGGTCVMSPKSAEELLRRADAALYVAKAAGDSIVRWDADVACRQTP